MRKTLFSCLIITLLVAGCKKEEKPKDTTNGYPTDGLTIEKQKNALLLMGYSTEYYIAPFDMVRLQLKHEYSNQLNTISIVSNSGVLNTPSSDSINNFLGSPGLPYFLLNGPMDILGANIPEEVETSLMEPPVLGVAHKVMENDTAYVVDCKVKFFEVPESPLIYIETYMIGKVRAKVFKGIYDLRMGDQTALVTNDDSASFWNESVVSLDSSEVLFKKGDAYYHNYVLIDNFNVSSPIGTRLGTYWPFSEEYYKGDVIGTKDTPIRHYFPKEDIEAIPFDFEPGFVTVVWAIDTDTFSLVYLNSYSEVK